jgi:hypothetical protein
MMHNGKWHERQWQRIEEEYQEPAREVVRVFHHEMMIPLCRVAEILFINESTLRRWCKMWKLDTRKSGYTKREVEEKVQFRARQLGYDSVSQAIADMRASGKRWNDICLKLKCSDATICRYMPDEAKGRYNLSVFGRIGQQDNAKKLNERMSCGEIERGGFAKVPLQMVNRI